jgi:hypothetical protein
LGAIIYSGSICCGLGRKSLFALEQSFDPGQLSGYDDLCVLRDRRFVMVKGSGGLATCPPGALEPALDLHPASLQQTKSSCRAEVSREGEPQGEVARIVGIDIGFEELFEQSFATLGDFVDLASSSATTRQCERSDLGGSARDGGGALSSK